MSKKQIISHSESADRVMVGARVPKSFRDEVQAVALETNRPMSQIYEWAMIGGFSEAKKKAGLVV